MCNNWPDFPIDVGKGATGGLIGDTVIICGGYDGVWNIDTGGYSVSKCYSLTSEKATLVTHMSAGRFGAASIVFNDNTLWVTGGNNGNVPNPQYLASTEYVTMTGTMIGPDLPMALYKHAMVAINSTFSMVIGGSYSNGYSASTFFYDRIEEEWINGPSLMQERYFHAAGLVTDEVTDEHFVAVTGGHDWYVGNTFDSTEILQDGEWVQGKISMQYHMPEQLPYYKFRFALNMV